MPEDCIRKKLSEKSQVSNCWLEQLYTFCDLERDPRARVLSIAYLGLMNEAESANLESKAAWFTVCFDSKDKPVFRSSAFELAEKDFGFDHYNIIKIAIERLRSKILYTNIVFTLMPREFTFAQLQSVYEVILNEKSSVANFRRKVENMIQETGQHTSGVMYRPAKLYTKKMEVNENEKATDRN